MSHIPAHVATGRRSPFPAGVFAGTLKDVKENWSEDKTGLFLLLTLGDVTPADEKSPNVGSRPKIQRLSIIFDNVSVVDIEVFDDNVPMTLSQSAGLITMLAKAFGVAVANADGSVDYDMGEFLEDLMGKVYNGKNVIFEVQNRSWKSKKTGNSGIDDSIIVFRMMDDGVAPAPEAPAPAEEAPAPAPVATPATSLRGARTRN